MVSICDGVPAFLWDDQSFSHTLVQIQRNPGSPNDSPAYFISTGVDFCVHYPLARSSGHLRFLHCLSFDLQKQDCMNFSVQVKVMPLKELLDPQGKAVMGGLQNLGIKTIQDVRIGKTIQLQVDAGTPDEAKKIAEEASVKLLANPVMEYFEISI